MDVYDENIKLTILQLENILRDFLSFFGTHFSVNVRMIWPFLTQIFVTLYLHRLNYLQTLILLTPLRSSLLVFLSAFT